MKKLLTKLKRKMSSVGGKAWLCSFVVALGLSALTYVLNNQPLFTGEELDYHAGMEWIKSKSDAASEQDTLRPLYINVSYDKQLITQYDDYSAPIGQIDITDRQKLLALLKMLHATEQYKYVFFDVRFEKGHQTDADSALFAEINAMKRIVVANHSNIRLADTRLAPKAAINDYAATLTTGFVRYVFSHKGQPTMPLFAFSELTGKTIEGNGLYYTCDGRPCYNSLFIRFPIESFEEEYDSLGHKVYYHLGSDILDVNDEASIATLTKDRYVVIGDMINDVHDTYAGSRPGPVITFYAFRALMRGDHLVSFWLVSFFFVVYFCMSLLQFTSGSLLSSLSIVKESSILHFVLSSFSYGAVLMLLSLLLNVFADVTTSILLPSVYFGVQNEIITYIRKRKKK